MKQGRSREVWIVAGICCLLLALLAWDRTVPSFWSADNGIKWWQAQTIAERGFQNALLDYSLADLDPEGRYQPLGWKFGRTIGSQIAFTYPPFYPSLLSVVGHFGGFRGSLFFTGLTAAFLIPIFFSLGKKHGIKFPLLFALFSFGATPILVYAIETNEHPLALGLGLTGWLLLEGNGKRSVGKIVAAGVFLGAAGWIREEYWIWGCACGLSLWIDRRGKGGLAVLLLLAASMGLNWWVQGLLAPESQVLRGVHIHEDIPQKSFGGYYFRYRWALLNHWLFSWGHYDEAWELSFWNPWPWIVTATFAFTLLARQTFKSWSLSPNRLLPGLFLVLGLVLLGHQFRICSIGIPHISGLFFSFPILALLPFLPFLGVVSSSRSSRRTIVALIVFAAVLWTLAGSSRGGRQWGPRYFMVTWPFLVGWAWKGMEKTGQSWKKVGYLSLIPLVLSQVLTLGYAFRTVRAQQMALPVETLAKLHEEAPLRVFVTDLEYLPGAAVGAGHSAWAVIPPQVPREEVRSFLEKVLNRDHEFLWCGKQPLPPDLVSGSREEVLLGKKRSFVIQLVAETPR